MSDAPTPQQPAHAFRPLLAIAAKLYERGQTRRADELLDAIQETAGSLGISLTPEFAASPLPRQE